MAWRGVVSGGMRKHLVQDFTQIYHLDLHGNVRQNPKLSGTTHNVFGIQVGVGITIAVRNNRHAARFIKYYRVPEDWRRTEKLMFLAEKKSIGAVAWHELQPDTKQTWLTEGMQIDFDALLPMGTKAAKAARTLTPALSHGERESDLPSPGGRGARGEEDSAVFWRFVDTGARLADIHLNYEQAKGYPLQWIENKDVPFSWRVTKMQLSKDKTQIRVNESLTLAGIPVECFDYRLGNRSALDMCVSWNTASSAFSYALR